MARCRSRAVRGAQRRPGGHGALSGAVERRAVRRHDRPRPGAHGRARLGQLGTGDRRRARRLHRPHAPGLRGALHALRRDRLAAGAAVLGPWLRQRSGTAGAGVRIRDVGIRRDRVVHRDDQHAVTSRDAAPRHATRPRRRLRPSARCPKDIGCGGTCSIACRAAAGFIRSLRRAATSGTRRTHPGCSCARRSPRRGRRQGCCRPRP